MDFIIVKLRDEITNNEEKLDAVYLEQIFNCYRALTDAPTIPWINFVNIVKNAPPTQEIYVYKVDNIPVALITLIIEQKLIHSGGLVGHIEDLAVDPKYQKQGIAKHLIQYCINCAREKGCYKVILDCKEDLVDFYKHNNFKQEGTYMCYRIIL